MITCLVCETENEDGVVSCILCGAPLEPPHPPASQEGHASHFNLEEPPLLPDIPRENNSSEHNSLEMFSSQPNDPLAQVRSISPQPILPSAPHLPPNFTPRLKGEPAKSTGLPAPLTPISTLQKVPPSPPQRQPTAEIPDPGTLCLIVYFERNPVLHHPVIYEEILIGRQDPASNSFPDLDLTPFDPELAISRKHCILYREQDMFYIYPISNSGTQINQEMVDIGSKKSLKEGDIIILSGRLAIRFARS